MAKRYKVFLAFAIIYIVWGSTYLANEYAIDHVPPFLMAGIRFSLAGALLLIYCRITEWHQISSRQMWNSFIFGFLFISLGMGCSVWGQQFVDSGITSLLVGINPLLVLLLVWPINGTKPTLKGSLGVLLGMVGIYLLINQDTVLSMEGAAKGIIATLIGVSGWVLGSIYLPKTELPATSLLSTSLQMLFGGLILLLVAIAQGSFARTSWHTIPFESWFAWGYLILFGSIIAFSAYNYLLTQVGAEKASTMTYVNPVIAVFLGWWFREEPVSAQTIVAAGLMLTGVYFINSQSQRE